LLNVVGGMIANKLSGNIFYSILGPFLLFLTILVVSSNLKFIRKLFADYKEHSARESKIKKAGLFYFDTVERSTSGLQEDKNREESEIDTICEEIAKDIRDASEDTPIELILASGYRSLRAEPESPIRNAIKVTQSKKIKVYLMNPDPNLSLIKERAEATDKNPNDFIESIKKSEEFLKEMHGRGKLNYSFYFKPPIFRLSRIGNLMYVQYFMSGVPSFKSVVYGFDSKDDGVLASKTLFSPFFQYLENFSEDCDSRKNMRLNGGSRSVSIFSSSRAAEIRGQLIDVSEGEVSMQVKVGNQDFFPTPEMVYSMNSEGDLFKGQVKWYSVYDDHVRFGLIKQVQEV